MGKQAPEARKKTEASADIAGSCRRRNPVYRRELLAHFKESLPKMAQDRYGHQASKRGQAEALAALLSSTPCRLF